MMQVKGEDLINKKHVEKVMKLMHTIYKYKYFFSIKGFFSQCLDDLMKEIDLAVQECIARNSDRTVKIAEINFGSNDIAICPEEQDEVIELLTRTHKERRNFLGHFPIWKAYRLETVKCLREIADELRKVEEHKNSLNLVASLSGLGAGLIKVAKTMKEYVTVPEYVEKAAPLLSAVNGVIRGYTCATHEVNLEQLTKRSEKVIKDDKRQFEVMMRWFDYNVKLMDAVKSAIGIKLYEFVFVKLKKLYDETRSSNQPNGENWKRLFDTMVEFLVKEGHSASLAVPLAAVSLKLFILFSSALLSLDWPGAALYVSRTASIAKTVVYGAHAALAANEVLNANGECNSNVGSYAGIILDLGPAIIDFSGLVKGDATGEQATNISKIADTIEGEISRIEHVFTTLNSE